MSEAALGLARVTETPPGIRLCALADLREDAARGFVLEMRAGRFHGFAVRVGDEVKGYVDACPHAGLPLAQKLDDYLTADGALVACSWHGALFRREDGVCVGGPCMGAKLSAWPLKVCEGAVVTA